MPRAGLPGADFRHSLCCGRRPHVAFVAQSRVPPNGAFVRGSPRFGSLARCSREVVTSCLRTRLQAQGEAGTHKRACVRRRARPADSHRRVRTASKRSLSRSYALLAHSLLLLHLLLRLPFWLALRRRFNTVCRVCLVVVAWRSVCAVSSLCPALCSIAGARCVLHICPRLGANSAVTRRRRAHAARPRVALPRSQAAVVSLQSAVFSLRLFCSQSESVLAARRSCSRAFAPLRRRRIAFVWPPPVRTPCVRLRRRAPFSCYLA